MSNESAHFSVKKEVGLHDTTLLKRALDSLPGVTSVAINKQSDSIAVGYNSDSVQKSDIRDKIEILGYPIQDMH